MAQTIIKAKNRPATARRSTSEKTTGASRPGARRTPSKLAPTPAKAAAPARAAAPKTAVPPSPSVPQAPSVRLVTVDERSVGQRLDNFLIKQLKGVPKTHVYRVIRAGEVRVNKGRAHADTRLEIGDEVLIEGTGAYTTTYSAVGFNGFPPLETFVI